MYLSFNRFTEKKLKSKFSFPKNCNLRHNVAASAIQVLLIPISMVPRMATYSGRPDRSNNNFVNVTHQTDLLFLQVKHLYILLISSLHFDRKSQKSKETTPSLLRWRDESPSGSNAHPELIVYFIVELQLLVTHKQLIHLIHFQF